MNILVNDLKQLLQSEGEYKLYSNSTIKRCRIKKICQDINNITLQELQIIYNCFFKEIYTKYEYYTKYVLPVLTKKED